MKHCFVHFLEIYHLILMCRPLNCSLNKKKNKKIKQWAGTVSYQLSALTKLMNSSQVYCSQDTTTKIAAKMTISSQLTLLFLCFFIFAFIYPTLDGYQSLSSRPPVLWMPFQVVTMVYFDFNLDLHHLQDQLLMWFLLPAIFLTCSYFITNFLNTTTSEFKVSKCFS